MYPFQSTTAQSPPSSFSNNNDTIGNSTAEPETKKVKLSHYQYLNLIENLKNSNNLFSVNPTPALPISSAGSSNILMVHKKLEERIGGILCCTVCLDLPVTVIYQCSNGHLMCAGCFSHLLADARLKDEQATCPNCRCEISKSSCCRNLAVEKTLSELPASCNYCNVMFSRNCLEVHQRDECFERPTKCVYKRIGCTWEGPYHELDAHSSQCSNQNKPGRDILPFLDSQDAQRQEDQTSISHLITTLSFDKICFNDLQFKQYKTDDITPKLYFETNRFSAFFHQWVLKARVNDNQKNPNLTLTRYISYQLILKSKLSNSSSSSDKQTSPSLDVKFCVLKGPFGEVPIMPCVQSFEFSQNKLETDYIKFNIDSADCNKLLASKIINFRFFMFQA